YEANLPSRAPENSLKFVFSISVLSLCLCILFSLRWATSPGVISFRCCLTIGRIHSTRKRIAIMHGAHNFRIRTANPSDGLPLATLRTRLWPESSFDEHARELAAILDGRAQHVLPLIIFVAEETNGTLVGFLEAGLRSCADGCDVSRPVGYVEGWFVEEHRRGQGIGSQLLRAAEEWARAQSCREMASDADIENQLSHRVHEASGFTVTARAILYRKSL